VKRILIVDDCPQIRGALRSVLCGDESTTVVEAANGAEAINVLQSEGAELVITDWQMDVMDGLECAKRIRAGIDPQLPIILMSGMFETEAKHFAYSAGIKYLLEKPFTPKQLYHSMALALNGQM
jgi:two-component system chemotaxis response regulator CheY/two-component system phosphate regulon response regulator PhoB